MSQENGLPPGWEVRQSRSRNLPYYLEPITGISSWEPPEGTDSNKLKNYMANVFSQNYPQIASQVPSSGTSNTMATKNSLNNNIKKNNQNGSEKIRASHLLIKHSQSRRPSSWKEQNITRSKDEAQSILKSHREKILSGETTLAKLASTESDCSSAHKGGDLGYFGRGEMQKEFENAAFALKPGQLSDIVESGSGFHIIQRTE